MRALLSHPSCDLMARDEEGNTALHLAASRGYCDIVEELASTTTGTPKEDLIINGQGTWNCSALVEFRNYCGNTPLLVASKEGKFEIAKLLLSKYQAKISACNNAKNTCLHLAALYGHIAVFELFVRKYSCNPSVKGCSGMTPLHYASAGGHIQLVDKMICEYNCEVSQDSNGNTPLHYAALCGSIAIIRVLISKYKCQVDCRNNKGDTPLICAASQGYNHVVFALCEEFDANFKQRNDK